MADCILVDLDETERINRFMARVKMPARPGDELIFLIRTATSSWGDVETQQTRVERGNITSREYRGSAWRFNLEREKQKAECNLALVCEALQRNGMNLEVKMYAGGLSKAVCECTKSGAANLVVMPANYREIQVVTALLAALRLFSHHVPPIPVLPSSYTKSGVERRCFH